MTRQTSTSQESAAVRQPASGWYPENFRYITQTLERLTAHRQDMLAAVFDFDNTCIHGDIGRSVFRHQLLQLHYRLPPSALANLIPTVADAVEGHSMETVRRQLLEDYTILYPSIADGRREEALAHPAHDRFVALFTWFADAARTLPNLGSGYVVTLMAQLLAGHTAEQVAALTRQTIDTCLAEPLGRALCQASFAGLLGSITASYDTGLRPYPEMIELMDWLQEHNIRCNLISASFGTVVQAAAPRFGFPIGEDNVYGIRLQQNPDATYSTKLAPDYPLTYRAGKADTIRNHVQGIPLLLAGDADTDYEMLVMPGIPIRLLINRNLSGLISTLYENPRYLLQGIDRQKGCFRPHRETL